MATHRTTLSFFKKNNYCKIFGLMVFGMISLGVSESFAVTVITLDTNKNSYGPGDLIEIHGQVQNSPNQLVAVEVKDPSSNTIMIRTVNTDANGNFVLKFKLPSTAKSGNYDVIANAKIDGNIIKETKTITAATIVPEFPLSTGIVMTIILAMSVVVARFKTSNLKF
jgi:hypothetical protein